MKTLMMSTAAVILATGVAFADASWDANSDGMIDREEFRAGIGENAFGTWDTDNDGSLSREEYEIGTTGQDDADSFSPWDERYGEWDADQDSTLSRDEYDEGLWGAFDADADDMWNDDESAAWEEDEMRYDATRSGREVSAPK
jgi:hypothetical protein